MRSTTAGHVTVLKTSCLQTTVSATCAIQPTHACWAEHVANRAATILIGPFALSTADSDVTMLALIGIADLPHLQQGSSCLHMRGQISMPSGARY